MQVCPPTGAVRMVKSSGKSFKNKTTTDIGETIWHIILTVRHVIFCRCRTILSNFHPKSRIKMKEIPPLVGVSPFLYTNIQNF